MRSDGAPALSQSIVPTWTGLHTFNVGLNVLSGQLYEYNGVAAIQAVTASGDWFFGQAGNLTLTGSYNTGVGTFTLGGLTTGAQNTGVGYNALTALTTGNYNTSVGVNSTAGLQTGSYNVAIGDQALHTAGTTQTAGAFVVGVNYTILTIGTTNFTAIGAASNTVGLTFTATGVGSGTGTAAPNVNFNTAIGFAALAVTVGNSNMALGYEALTSNTLGVSNVGVGVLSLAANTTGNFNVGVGGYSLYVSTTASNNTAIGYSAHQNSLLANRNVAIGTNAMVSAGAVQTAGSFFSGLTYTIVSIGTTDFTAIGAASNTVGLVFACTGAGSGTGTAAPDASINTAVGYNALTLASGYGNTAIGYNSLNASTSGINNVGLGTGTLQSNTTGSYNLAIGGNALQSNTTGTENMALGYAALVASVYGSYNAAIGPQALTSGISPNYNVAIGYVALADLSPSVTAGSFVSGISYTILTIGTTNFTLIGAASNTVGLTFTATGVGSGTGTASANAQYNTIIGTNTGRGITYGSNNTVIGARLGSLSAGLTGAILLGNGAGLYQADYGVTVASSWMLNSSATNPGVFLGSSSLGVYWGSGAPSFSAGKGSLYINTSATTTTTRLYINSSGSTTWASFTASA